MKKLPLIIALALAPSLCPAAGGGYPLDDARVDLSDQPSLQRGAKYFVNYCMGCHSLDYLRYNRLGRDLGLTDKLVEENLIFTRAEDGSPTRVGERMSIAMSERYGEQAFGVAPPDLTLTARSRGEDWIYTYLRTFYLDEDAQWGVDNAVFPGVAMPHVLWQLQGLQKPVYEERTDGEGESHRVITGFELVQPGSMSPEEYDRVARDLTNFLVYAAEPAKLVRYRIGGWVLVFLVFFAVVAYFLKKEYWRDVK